MIFDLLNRPDHRLMCSLAGAEYLGTENGTVIFRDPLDQHVMRLWVFAAKSPHDFAGALKAHREFVKDFPAWEPVEK
jgi:hypothetical protein